MIENVNYNLGRKYDFYAIISLSQKSKREIAIAIKKEIAHKRVNIRTAFQAVALKIYMTEKGQYTQYIYPNRPGDGGRY